MNENDPNVNPESFIEKKTENEIENNDNNISMRDIPLDDEKGNLEEKNNENELNKNIEINNSNDNRNIQIKEQNENNKNLKKENKENKENKEEK